MHRATTATTTPSTHRAPGPPTPWVPSAQSGHQRSEPPRRPGSPRLPPLPDPASHPLRRAGRSPQAGRPGQEKPPSRWACRRRRHLDAVVGGAGRGGWPSRARRRGAVSTASGGGRRGAAETPLPQPGGGEKRGMSRVGRDPRGPSSPAARPAQDKPSNPTVCLESIVQALLELWQAWGLVLMIPLSVPQSSAGGKPFCCRYPVIVNTKRCFPAAPCAAVGASLRAAAPSAAPGPFGRAGPGRCASSGTDPLWLGKSRGWNNLESSSEKCMQRSWNPCYG